MQIILEDIGKKFGNQWVFRHLYLDVSQGSKCAILGANGSGKSTLLKIMARWLNPTEGNVMYFTNGQPLVDPENIFLSIAVAAPYLELVEEFTLLELFRFHFQFKKPLNNLSLFEIIELSGLEAAAQKQIRHFSSGMKQRTKLTLALLSEAPFVLLDEPCSNLDAKAIEWYRNLIFRYGNNRTLVICSNHQPCEYDFCKDIMTL